MTLHQSHCDMHSVYVYCLTKREMRYKQDVYIVMCTVKSCGYNSQRPSNCSFFATVYIHAKRNHFVDWNMSTAISGDIVPFKTLPLPLAKLFRSSSFLTSFLFCFTSMVLDFHAKVHGTGNCSEPLGPLLVWLRYICSWQPALFGLFSEKFVEVRV